MSDVSSVPTRPTSPINLTANDPLPAARPYRFTWDPASRRPGPESVSGTTEGRGGDDFGEAPAPFTFLNPSSLSLALGNIPSEWSSSRTGFHAISTVLNNPHKRQAPPKPHSTLPPVPAAALPRVRRKDFDSYLRSIGPEWDTYEKNLRLGQRGQMPINANQWLTSRNSIAGSTDRDDDDDSVSPSSPPPIPTTPTPGSLISSDIPPLDSVPDIFFAPDFNLGDPRTFARVTEQDAANALLSPQDDVFSDPLSQSHSAPLRDRFSHYVDTVEQHLAREISIRSTSFFAALTNLHDLQAESEHCLYRITKLRGQLKDVDNQGARKGLEMVRKEYKMANLYRVKEGVKMMHGVVEMTAVVKDLVNAGQWGEALGVIEQLERIWDTEEGDIPDTAVSAVFSPVTPTIQRANGHVQQPLSAMPEEDEEEQEGIDSPRAPKTPATPASAGPQGPRPAVVSLKSLHAFSALPSHLRALTMQIAASLSSDFVQILRQDLDARIAGDGKPNPDADQGLKDRLKPLLLNLVRTKGLKEGMLSWREVVMVEVRSLLKRVVPGFAATEDDENSESRVGLADHLKGMEHPEFMGLLQAMYRSIVNCLEGLQTQGQMIVEVLDLLRQEKGRRLTDVDALQEDLTDIVCTSGELSNTHAAKVISYRSEQHATLELPAFLTFFKDSFAFVVKCERICNKMLVGLRGPVMDQAKLFLQTFHQTRLTTCARRVEDEIWAAVDVLPTLQHTVDILVDSAVRDHPELIINTDDAIFSPQSGNFPSGSLPGQQVNGVSSPPENGPTSVQAASTTSPPDVSAPLSTAPPTTPAPPTTARPGGGRTKHLRIEDRAFYVVSATTEVLTLLVDYLKIVVNLSIITPETMSRVIEFLKVFNSRTSQVVLGAGAMRSAGLRNITAKHLALASQSITVVFELIPYVRETFRRHLKQTHTVLLVEFDRVKRDYQEHQNEIYSKLVSIMFDRLQGHVKSLKAVDWNAPAPASGVNSYMELLVSETTSLHKILSRYLATSAVKFVMSQVFADINHAMTTAFNEIELPNLGARERLLADAQYLHRSLSALRNTGGSPMAMLETIIRERGSQPPPLPSQQQASTDGTANASAGSNSRVTPTRSNTLSANQRLRGLLSPRSATPATPTPAPTTAAPSGSSTTNASSRELPLPQPPSRTPSPPPPVPPSTDKPMSPVPGGRNGVYNGVPDDSTVSLSAGQLVLPMGDGVVPVGGASAGRPNGNSQ